MANPMDSHWTTIKHILRYLKGYIHHGLHFKVSPSSQPFTIKALCDVDQASDPNESKFTSVANDSFLDLPLKLNTKAWLKP